MGKDQHLLEASRGGDIKTVDKLLEHSSKRHGPLSSFRRSPSINCQDMNGYTSLHHACLNGHSNIVRLLLSHNALLDVPDIRGSTPLFLAAWAGHQDIVKMLLMHTPTGANPNAQTIENETPLHSGAQHGHNAVVAILLSYGADPAIRNNSFQTALDLAAQFGRLQVVQTLLRIDPDLILPYKRLEEDEELLGCSPIKHIFTHTCLHLASRNGHKKVVETLLAAGVDVNILTNAGSALHEAALCGKKSVVVTLLKAGIYVHATDGNGRTALDILSDYPPHVTYDIVAAINEFTQATREQKPLAVENGTQSLPKRLYEKNSQRQKLPPRQRKKQDHQANGLSHSLSSLDVFAKAPDNYLQMKPIIQQKSCDNMTDIKSDGRDPWSSYKPVYKQPILPSFRTGSDISNGSVPSRSYEYINLLRNGSASDDNSASTSSNSAVRQQAVATYVEMTLPSPPVPKPRTRINGEYNDYANLVPIEEGSCVADVDNNNNSNGNGNKLRLVRHSPTPDYPPPTVTEAERTIFNFMQPATLRKNSLLELGDSPRTTNSVSSDQVEEFVADVPFAGLFKGSTLNLSSDVVDGNGSQTGDREFLRSPSMVRSAHAQNHRRSLSKQRFSALGEDFSASRVWAEIDTIFENIGNEVSTVEYETDELISEPTSLSLEDSRQSLHIRDPAELLLGRKQSSTSNWCHSPYTLIYGEIRYSLFYLGSTVIRKLQGTLSTRKSIQKLKIDENMKSAASVSDFSLLENCTTSTKYLKAANLQSRLNVDIAVSCIGVKFIDHDKKTAICCHEIENINCVCQDSGDLRYFAYITKEQDLHYCHVFMVDSLELAKEIIMTLGQAFEVAYQLALSRQGTPLNGEC
ncbi:ankyrin repeat and sterile alpha motif domain-containing protein 1B isoform X1 [Drosophila eugracilis]|uniref:ankyrin repeat and sterile alpha motif domain-containing protein 1B isoform X1 n=1 Tax=Drosophila eugracilis TaxID=29029 RepID=UPI001BD9B351|nr:ankyrin repeat and sterile alpha motif domain-containing protein 1B isoform X1 [Drosophila eugracilis]XP_017079983.2 ankyrin repeat and sterile alpha motif domain-containing protein 1B isoform X1 [Drosophila eugracilis]